MLWLSFLGSSSSTLTYCLSQNEHKLLLDTRKKSPSLVELMVLEELESCWWGDPSFQTMLQNYAFAVSSSAAEFIAAFSLIWQQTGPHKHFIQWSSPSPLIILRVQLYLRNSHCLTAELRSVVLQNDEVCPDGISYHLMVSQSFV